MNEFQSKFRFDAPPAPPRVVRATSLEALAAIRKTLPMREAAVFEALELMVALRSGVRPPTAYELLRYMQSGKDGAFDLNSVRPRLTALKEKGLVENGDKVVCMVTKKKAFTWQPSKEWLTVQRSKAA